MSALLPEQKERQRRARSRAGHIRFGMQTMEDTFEHIARARAEGDHLTLGYETWAEYVDGEFGAGRVKLSAEKRNEYIGLLALAGASQREIAHTVGVSPATVNRRLGAGVSNETDESDGHPDPPARSDLVDALTGAIEDADQRAQDHRETPSPGAPVEGADKGPAPSTEDHRFDTTGEAAPSATGPAAEETDGTSDQPSVSSAPNPFTWPGGEREAPDLCPTCLQPLPERAS